MFRTRPGLPGDRHRVGIHSTEVPGASCTPKWGRIRGSLPVQDLSSSASGCLIAIAIALLVLG